MANKKPPADKDRGLVMAKLTTNGRAFNKEKTFVEWAPLYRAYYYTVASIESL
ncbi:MAG: hypothetical protein NT086_22505 [Proteobacteria bacterium]|jgi:hypothetical protein|nr:hypothetical protein [Pseudomonadota bacterium]